METVIIQHGRECQKCKLSEAGSKLTIGRAFSSDIILTDPYVGPSQLQIQSSTGVDYRWSVTNLDSSNPVLLNKKIVESSEFEITSGDEITIGRTKVLFYSEDHVVPKTREFSFTNWLHNHKYKPLFASVMLLFLFCVALWGDYSETSSETNLGKLSAAAMLPVVIAFIWASAWSLTGRILKSDHYFFSHLFFTAFSFSLLIILSDTYSYFDYMLSSVLTGELIDWFLTILIFGLLIGFNLALVTYSPGAFKKGMIASVCILGVTASLIHLYEEDYDNKPAHSYTIKPSYIPTSAPVNIEKFIANYEVLFDGKK
ncbi:MAG: FHA domain-containing protein [Gammaproteobacteria bacterium]|nr:FHA domain-containing protein [Gammaproteobacteria bacterium]